MILSRRTTIKGVSASLLVAPYHYAFAAAPPLKTHSADAIANSLGVCVHLSYSNTVYGRFDEIILPLARDMKIRHMRDGIPTAVKPNPRMWQFVRGRKLVAAGVKFSCVTLDGVLGQRTLIEQLPLAVGFYDGGVDIFEGGNESNLAHKSNWASVTVDYQHALYQGVKNNTQVAKIPVAGPSLFIPGNAPAGDYEDAVDFGNIHAYPGDANPESTTNGALDVFIHRAIVNTGNRPLIVSETGYHSALETKSGHPPISEAVIARYLPRLVLYNFMRGIRKTYIYEFADTYARGLTDKESNFGLVRATGEPKPAYHALRNLIALFNDPGAAPSVRPLAVSMEGPSTTAPMVLTCQRRDGTYLVAAWLPIPGWTRATKVAIPPTSNPFLLRTDRPMTLVDVTRFDDSGQTVVENVRTTFKSHQVQISDNLSVLRLANPS